MADESFAAFPMGFMPVACVRMELFQTAKGFIAPLHRSSASDEGRNFIDNY